MEALRQLVPLEIFDYPSLLNLRNASTRLLLKDESSHCINVYLIRSLIHLKLSYPDLAASDAYRALNLIDYARERISEWDDDVNFSDVSVSIGDNALRRTLSLLGLEEPEDNSPKLDDLLERCEDVALCLLSRGLRESGCARDAHRFLGQGLNRVKNIPEDNSYAILRDLVECVGATSVQSTTFCDAVDEILHEDERELEGAVRKALLARAGEDIDLLQAISENTLAKNIQLLPRTFTGIEAISNSYPEVSDGEFGACRRETYPWNRYEPDRLGKENLEELNEIMMRCSNGAAVVAAVELPSLDGSGKTNTQLGVYANRDIEAGEEFFKESSFVVGVLDPYSGLICDFCSEKLYEFNKERKAGESVYEQVKEKVHCEECLHKKNDEDSDEDMDDYYSDQDDQEVEAPTFCSEVCREKALQTYHKALCSKDIKWLYTEVKTAHSARYMWLLMALKLYGTASVRFSSPTNTLPAHPLLMPEAKAAWGTYGTRDFSSPDQTPRHLLPFSFALQLQHPLRMLYSLNINPFLPSNLDTYDTWVLNTLYAKFLGTASSRLAFGTSNTLPFSTGENRPEVTALHLAWSLVNHSCEPNVRWECEGTIRFQGFRKDGSEGVAVKKGEEILQSYCDINMPVGERRGWMRGSLGGDCMCGRCLREAS